MKFVWFAVLIWMSVGCCQNAPENKNSLLLVQMIFRHCARAPFIFYPSDPNPLKFWSDGPEQLTELGIKQHYSLGKFLRSMYRHFITLNPNEVIANSSELARCRKGAQATLASLYAPNSEWTLEENLKWQPIPVSYLPLLKDKYLCPVSECPKASVETERLSETSEIHKLLDDHREMLEHIANQSGLSFQDRRHSVLLYDTFLTEKRHNLITPAWLEPYWDELDSLTDSISSIVVKSLLLQRLRAGPFLQNLIENMNKKTSGSLPDLKLQIYSSHDINILILLQALGVYNWRKPPFCATLIFELHEGQGGQKLVRLLYLNATKPEEEIQKPHVLTMDGCSEFCPLEFFIDFTKHLIPEDWDKECKLVEITSDGPNVVASRSSLLLLICIGVLMFCIITLYKFRKSVRGFCNTCVKVVMRRLNCFSKNRCN